MKQFRLLVLVLASLTIFACTSSSSDDDGGGDDLSRNACSTLGLETRIINGTSCRERGSSVVRITLVNTDGTAGLCSGVMLTNDDVLTAAHCFFGSVRSAVVEVNGERASATRVVLHPDVAADQEALAVFNDVAIVQLGSGLSTSTLPVVGSRDVDRGDIVSIYGYGLDEDGKTDVLRSGEMKVSDVSDNHVFAAFNGDGSNTCNGDSGGPAVWAFTDDSGVARLGVVGVVSSGNDVTCGTGDVTLFTNVQFENVLNFIRNVVPDANVV